MSINIYIYICNIYVYNNIICKLIRLKAQSNSSLKRYVLTRHINCLTVPAYFIESGRLFQSLGAAIENALSPYVVVDDLGTINTLLVTERKARFGL